MRATILPLGPDHLASCAALLAARHQHDRRWATDLSPEYEDAAAALPLLEELLASSGTQGVVAIRDDSVIGYLIGSPELGLPTRPFAGFMHPRAAEITYAGHAVGQNEGQSLYPRLYAALAQQWVKDGLVGHYITVPAYHEMLEVWSDLGFGRFIALGVRLTTPSAARATHYGMDMEFRRANLDDEEAVQALMTEFFRTFADPPLFVPFLPETTAERRRFVTDNLADSASPHWLAVIDGRVVGMQMFQEPHSPHWHEAALQMPQQAVYLFLAWTAPEVRSTGVGAALFAHSMTWARDAGYDTCMAHFLTASRAAPFWRGLGFQPVSYWLTRTIDERMTWASGRA